MKKLFLTGVAALAIESSTANAQLAYDPPVRATPFLVTNGAPPPPPPIGWATAHTRYAVTRPVVPWAL